MVRDWRRGAETARGEPEPRRREQEPVIPAFQRVDRVDQRAAAPEAADGLKNKH